MITYRLLKDWFNGNDRAHRNQPSSLTAYNAVAIASIGSTAPTYKQWIHTDPWGKGFAQKDYKASAVRAGGGTYEQWLETLPDVSAMEVIETVEPEPFDLVTTLIEEAHALLNRQHRNHASMPAVSP